MQMEQNHITWMISPSRKDGAMGSIANADRPVEPRMSAPADDGGAHHRSTHRQRTLKAAKVILTDWTTMDCTVRDISASGARLVFGDAFKLPEEFRVHIAMTNTVVPARLLWQRGLTAGVTFTGPEEPAPTRHKPAGA
jgi:hypothetical protein